jgi:hypothetical protein
MEILACKCKSKNDPNMGFIYPLAEMKPSQVIKLSEDNFEGFKNNVIIFNNYSIIDAFKEDELFKIKIQKQEKDLNRDSDSSYGGHGNNITKLAPKELVEIFSVTLPEENNRTIAIEYLPNTDYIVIADDDYYYGIFEWKKDDEENYIKIIPLTKNFPGKTLLTGQINKIEQKKINDKHLLTLLINSKERRYLQNVNVASWSIYDYASDIEILSYCIALSKSLGNKNITITDLEKFSNQHKNEKDLKERWKKFERIIMSVKSLKNDYITDFIPHFKTDAGQDLVKEYFESNKVIYFNQIKQEKKQELEQSLLSQNDKLVEIQNEIKEKQKTLNEVQTQIDKKLEEKKITDENKIRVLLEEQNKKIKDRTEELIKLESEIDTIKKEHTELSNAKSLKEEQIYLEKNKDKLEKKIKELKEEQSQVERLLREDEVSLRNKLIEFNSLFMTMNNSYSSIKTKELDISVPCSNIRTGKNGALIEDQMNTINSIKESFAKNRRFLEDWEVSNLLITTQQSMLTILAGLPGSGKTSLARLLAKTQGLDKRLCEIAISRGWTSSKDLIGMFNPINSTFQPSSTGLYDFIRTLSLEKDYKNNPMSYVLLDEANLSPMEHYWSSFIGMTDNNDNKEILLNQAEKFSINDSLKFLATVNYDETTELISPRILDRAPILILESKLEENQLSETNKIDFLETPFSYEIMEELFGKKPHIPDLEDLENDLINKINQLSNTNTGSSSFITLSHRKLNSIKQYCHKAKPLMKKYHEAFAIDLAVLQYVLPLIDGQGESYGKKLNSLKEILISFELEKSFNYLEKIINIGDQDFNSYNFFYW